MAVVLGRLALEGTGRTRPGGLMGVCESRPVRVTADMDIGWNELLRALALLLVVEGILPFLSPPRLKRACALLITMPDRQVRLLGLISMVVGAVVLNFVGSP